MSRHVLVIEDNRDIAHLLELHLRDLGCEVRLAFDGATGLAQARTRPYDLIILDSILPGMDGLEILKRLRSEPGYLPILMLTARSTDLDRVLGLELGADDYLTKPFNVLELLARVKALFRRVDALSSQPDDPVQKTIQAGPLSIDTVRRAVSVSGRSLDLTAKEFDLLVQFARHPGRVYTRSDLLDQVWGYAHDGYEHTVNSHINRLRSKIETDPAHPRYILTVWGIGYKFSEPSSWNTE
ncbi:MAG: response regulator transcription factor [Leptospirales bacterium]